jgi:putative salt-induced outer membrane protein YdiY
MTAFVTGSSGSQIFKLLPGILPIAHCRVRFKAEAATPSHFREESAFFGTYQERCFMTMSDARKRRFPISAMVCLAVTSLVRFASGDQIVMNNGDTITGTINSAEDGKLTISSLVEGKVTVNLSDVKTFSTDQPIDLKLDDGSIVHQQVSTGAPGTVNTGAGAALAQQALSLSRVTEINPPPVAWTGSLVLNGLYTQANTTTEQLGVNADATRKTDADRITAGAGYLFALQKTGFGSTTTADTWFFTGEYDLYFTKKFYAYGDGRVEKDRINFLDLRLTPGVGVGYDFVAHKDAHLSGEAGISWVYEKYSSQPTANENVSARVGLHADKSFCDDKFKVYTDASYLPSIQNSSAYLVLFDAGARMALTKNMFTELRTEQNYSSTPGPGAKRTQSRYLVGVGWTF